MQSLETSLKYGGNQYQLSNSLRLFCESHQSELLTNFCSHPQCFRALCPDCIEAHNRFHKSSNTFAEIDSIKNVKLFCSRKLNTGIVELQKILEDLENTLLTNDGDDQVTIMKTIYNKNLIKIQKSRDYIIDIVNQYFNKLEDQYKNSQELQNYKQDQLNNILDKIRNSLNELEYLQVNMEGLNTLNTIKRVCVLDLKKTIEKFRKECKQTETYRTTSEFQVMVDNKMIDNLEQQLSKFIFLNNFVQQQKPQQSYMVESKKLPIFQPFTLREQQPLLEPFQLEPNLQQKTLKSEILVQSYTQQNSFFNQNCRKNFLHFFQSGDNILWLYDLNEQKGWSKRVISLQNQIIPSFSKSIISKDGDIYLIGGSQNQATKSGEIFYMDLQKNELVSVGRLKHPRSSHSVIYYQNGIAVIGGYTNGQRVISQCEFFDIKTNNLMSLGLLNVAVASPGVCSFDELGIIKIGGIDTTLHVCNEIELFVSNQWVKLQVSSEIKLMSMCCCIQINLDEVMIFGGYTEENQGSNQCFSIIVNDKQAIFKNDLCNLPFAEGFWNNNPIIYKGNVYALQNTTDDQGENCLEDVRTIIVFDGVKWNNF